MTAQEILKELKPLGRESHKRLLMNNHGVQEPLFGVPISELKKFQRRIKRDYQLALDLYDTGNYDAMYLAGLIADDARMTRKDLQGWLDKASRRSAAYVTVAWVATGSPHGWELALKWIGSPKDLAVATGWSILSGLVAIKDDAELDLVELKRLLARVQKTIHDAPDRVRHQMNAFVISVGCYVESLTEHALKLGEKIGPVICDLGNNDCKTPFAPDYIRKVQARGTIGKKRKTIKC